MCSWGKWSGDYRTCKGIEGEKTQHTSLSNNTPSNIETNWAKQLFNCKTDPLNEMWQTFVNDKDLQTLPTLFKAPWLQNFSSELVCWFFTETNPCKWMDCRASNIQTSYPSGCSDCDGIVGQLISQLRNDFTEQHWFSSTYNKLRCKMGTNCTAPKFTHRQDP